MEVSSPIRCHPNFTAAVVSLAPGGLNLMLWYLGIAGTNASARGLPYRSGPTRILGLASVSHGVMPTSLDRVASTEQARRTQDPSVSQSLPRFGCFCSTLVVGGQTLPRSLCFPTSVTPLDPVHTPNTDPPAFSIEQCCDPRVTVATMLLCPSDDDLIEVCVIGPRCW